MNKPFDKIFAALRLIPVWDIADVKIIHLLGSGPSNENWLVKHQNRKYAFRIDKPFAKQLPLDRHNEVLIHQLLADPGIAPGILFSDPDSGFLITHFIEGRTWHESDLKNKQQLTLLADHLQKLHAHSADVKHYDLIGGIKLYASQLNTAQADAWANEALLLLDDMNERPMVICHNDLLPQNIIETDNAVSKRLWFVDLEYSGLGNPLFDLATVIEHHQLNDELLEHFLSAYFVSFDKKNREDIHRFRKVYVRLLALWYSILIKNNPDDKNSKQLFNKLVNRSDFQN